MSSPPTQPGDVAPFTEDKGSLSDGSAAESSGKRARKAQRPLLPLTNSPIPISPRDSGSTPRGSSAGIPTPDGREPPARMGLTPDPDPFPDFSRFVHRQKGEGLPVSWVSDLELLHHFTTSTYKSLPRALEPVMGSVWQVEIPRLAFRHVFLLHQILATAAFHLSRLRPDMRDDYSLMATHHQNLAIQGMRVLLKDLNEENCHAVFATSSLSPWAAWLRSPVRRKVPGRPWRS